MKPLLFLVLTISILACTDSRTQQRDLHFKMENLQVRHQLFNNHTQNIYVPVYTDVFHIDQSKLFPLTVTLSMRNTSMTDSVYVYQVDYHNSKGERLKQHIPESKMLVLAPLESYDLVINKMTYSGDTGANFILNWGKMQGKGGLFVQAVMINTSGQQGLSFITDGVIID